MSWTQCMMCFLPNYFSLRRHLSTLRTRIRHHETLCGSLHVRHASFGTMVRRATISLAVINTGGSLVFAGAFFVWTGWRRYLSPFEEAEPGSGIFLMAVTLLSVFMYLGGTVQTSLLTLMLLLSLVIRKELQHVAHDLQVLLSSGMELQKSGLSADTGKTERDIPPGCVGQTFSGGCKKETTALQTHEAYAKEVDATFCRLRRRHESACALLSGSRDCLQHLAPVCYVFSFPTLFLIIYAVASGSLALDETVPLVCVGINCVFNTVFTTCCGIIVHDALQLLAMRITSGDDGYNVYGLFTITRGTVLMIGGTFLTYTVVVIQFQLGSHVTSFCDIPPETKGASYLGSSGQVKPCNFLSDDFSVNTNFMRRSTTAATADTVSGHKPTATADTVSGYKLTATAETVSGHKLTQG
ncbi:hypothetical protein BaRGS_00031839 [Batillaria attramentaria]|uniref:Uncharacterized protein n=1 Tax=Batillaria attramentaria TaxID=370345 RepID=A0ABD0JPC7_9CAEN